MPAFKTNDFWIIDAVDQSKVLQFDVASLGTGTTRTLTAPYNGNGTLAILEAQNVFAQQQFFPAGLYSATSGTVVPIEALPAAGANGIRIVQAASPTNSAFIIKDSSAIAIFEIDSAGNLATDSLVFNSGSGNTNRLTFSLAAIPAATTRAAAWPNVPGQVAFVGNGADPPAAGAIGKVNRTAQVAAITSTKLTDTTPAGYYVVDWTLEATTADVTAGTIQLTVAYTDDIGATTQLSAALVLTATGRDRGSFQVWLASGNITYSTTLVGIIGTSAYALRMRATFLG